MSESVLVLKKRSTLTAFRGVFVRRTPPVTHSSGTASSPHKANPQGSQAGTGVAINAFQSCRAATTGAAKGLRKQEAKKSSGQGPRERSYLSRAAQAWEAVESTPPSPSKKRKRDDQTGRDVAYKLRERKDGR
jgi:hypothetical protein